MWFGFGLITLLAAFGFSLYTRRIAGWSGKPRTLTPDLGGRSYDYQEVRHKQRLRKVRIGIAGPTGFDFTVRAEGKRDSFFKWIGICAELQVRDREFDKAIYIESDARGLGLLLNENKELRGTLLEVVNFASAHELRGVRIRCAYDRLWVEFNPKQEASIPAAETRFVPLLYTLRDRLENNRLQLADMRDPFILRAAILLSISTASAVFGLYGIIRAASGRTDILEPWKLLATSAIPGVLLLLCFLIAILYVLGRSSRTHLVLMEAALVGGFGFVLSAFAFARDANVDLDTRAATPRELHGVQAEHRVTNGRRGRKNHHYYLHAADWRAGHTGEALRLEISEASFHQLRDVQDAVIYIRPGAFGYEWVERIEPGRLGVER